MQRFEALAQKKESFFAQEDLNHLVREILEMLHPEIVHRHIRLVTNLHPLPIYSRLNRHLLKVALAHLLRNAMEATGPGGEIRLGTGVERSFAVITLQDTGQGMPPEVVEKVFMPFYTTKIGGTGLGMVFVSQIVDEHRGIITLEKSVGPGHHGDHQAAAQFCRAPGGNRETLFPDHPRISHRTGVCSLSVEK